MRRGRARRDGGCRVRVLTEPADHARLGELPHRRREARARRDVRGLRRPDRALRPRLLGGTGAARRAGSRRDGRRADRERAGDARPRPRGRVAGTGWRALADRGPARRDRGGRRVRDAARRRPGVVGAPLLRHPRGAARGRRRRWPGRHAADLGEARGRGRPLLGTAAHAPLRPLRAPGGRRLGVARLVGPPAPTDTNDCTRSRARRRARALVGAERPRRRKRVRTALRVALRRAGRAPPTPGRRLEPRPAECAAARAPAPRPDSVARRCSPCLPRDPRERARTARRLGARDRSGRLRRRRDRRGDADGRRSHRHAPDVAAPRTGRRARGDRGLRRIGPSSPAACAPRVRTPGVVWRGHAADRSLANIPDDVRCAEWATQYSGAEVGHARDPG